MGQTIIYYMLNLSEGKKNKVYTIVGYCEKKDKVSRRFMELGFSVGQKVKIVATSLQKKVFLIEIRGYLLSVRASLLAKVKVK